MEKNTWLWFLALAVAFLLTGVPFMTEGNLMIGYIFFSLALIVAALSTIRYANTGGFSVSWKRPFLWGTVVIFAVIGFSIARFFYPGGELEPRKIPTSIYLQFDGGDRVNPNTLSGNIHLLNIAKIDTPYIVKDPFSVKISRLWYIYLVFEKPIIYDKPFVRFSTAGLPPVTIEAELGDPRCAIIALHGDMPAGTLAIEMK